MTDLVYWIAFNRVPGIGPTRLQALLHYFADDLQAAWEADPYTLAKAGLDRRSLESLVEKRKTLSLEKELALLARHDVIALTWSNPAYPRLLRDIPTAPPVLYVRGELSADDEIAVALVGTRNVSPYGRAVAEKITRDLSDSRLTIVSGLALGVDRIAHETALANGGRTIAVLAHGVDSAYPAANRKLADAIVSRGQGALVSDYPIGTKPEASNFPPRNRIISGLSLATVVIEAGERSGALITAQFALEQGREVMAVPGNILSPQSRGTNDLISQGATPVLGAESVLRAINYHMAEPQRVVRQAVPATPTEAHVLGFLSGEPIPIDELIRLTTFTPAELNSTLALLELKGSVRQVGGMRYIRL